MKKILFLPIICFIIIFSNQSFSQTELLDTENLLKQLREAMCPKADAECEAAQLKFDEFKKLITDVAEEERVSNTEPILENMDIEKIIIGRVLRVNKGKGFAGDEKLKKRNPVKTGTVFSTLAGGTMTLMLDEKTRIFIGDESEIMIKEFLISEPKSHKVTIDLTKGSFQYKTLRKTQTDLTVSMQGITNIEKKFTSEGFNTSVAFINKPDENELRFVNAGESKLSYGDKIFSAGDTGVINMGTNTQTYEKINNKFGDNLIGQALKNSSMTTTAAQPSTSNNSGSSDSGSSDSGGGDSGSSSSGSGGGCG